MVLKLQEHKEVNQCGELIRVKPRKTNQLIAEIPIPGAGSPYDHKTKRSKCTKIKFVQFPINISNARTVHKLQGKTIENLMIASFDYADNWICGIVKSYYIRRIVSHEGFASSKM